MLTIGMVVAAHSLRGEVRVQPFTDFPDRFDQLEEIWISAPDGTRKRYELRRVAHHQTKGLMILGFAGVSSRSAATRLVGGALEIEDGEAVELPEGTYFEHDIVGLRVATVEGVDLGVIREILRTGANDVYVTPQCLIPAIEDVVKEIDIEGGRMIIQPIPGLLDE